MLTLQQNIVILISMMAGSMLFMAALNRIWPREKRQVHNDLIGWQLNIIGTTYAVILGFMLYTVWTDFGAANLNVDLEASALRNIYRLAQGLPETQRIQLELQARSYAQAVIDQDWPEMARSQTPEESHNINQAMWKTLMSVKLATPSEIVAEDHALSELSSLIRHPLQLPCQKGTMLSKLQHKENSEHGTSFIIITTCWLAQIPSPP